MPLADDLTTHAPLVLASVETLFGEERDQLLHFSLRDGKIVAEPIPWAKQGDAVNWLVSEAFGLHQGRSREAERAIGERKLFPAVRQKAASAVVVAAGTSCRHQIAHFTGEAALHPAVLLAQLIEGAR